ncbi:MAG: efflux transporter outer membrane subunit [Sphingomonadales bacterium]|nr:efflux transporter outer membrane subunit [Sphingomonadales bacterium]MDE2567293.1 efflux transporter outer membrane subunit [Sphingomonadales bacterium]
MRRLAVLAPFALAGCSLAPRTQLPPPPVPESWPVGDAYLAQSEAGVPAVTYAEVFRDPRLHKLVETALANNRDIRVAAANLAAARAQVRVTRAAQFPALGVSASASETQTGTGASATTSDLYQVQGGVSSFELDLFGKLANATQAQRDRALSTEAAARTVRLGLVANLASAWASYAADKDLLAIAQETAKNAQESVRLTSARLEGGIAPRTDLSQAQQILATAEGNIALQKTALAQDVNLLRLLSGTEVDPALLPASLAEIDQSFAALPAGLNSDVLLRRPDVIEAEYLLRAANANIGVARAQLFPSISLTGLLGFASNALSDLFASGAFSATAKGAAGWSIFNAGGASANVAVSKAQRDAALATYEKAIQTAFRETADALATQGTLADRLRAAHDNTEAAATTARLSDARYKGGIDSFLTNLVAQRSLYTARQGEVAVRLASVLNRITVYRVLGGDQATQSSAK